MGWPRLRPRKNLTSCPGLVDHYNIQDIIKGLIIVVAVVIDQYRNKRKLKR
jgi:ABC-type glucose/galactose transport system permease subunit